MAVYTHIHPSLRPSIHPSIHACIHPCIYAYVYIYLSICIYIYIYIYIDSRAIYTHVCIGEPFGFVAFESRSVGGSELGPGKHPAALGVEIEASGASEGFRGLGFRG